MLVITVKFLHPKSYTPFSREEMVVFNCKRCIYTSGCQKYHFIMLVTKCILLAPDVDHTAGDATLAFCPCYLRRSSLLKPQETSIK